MAPRSAGQWWTTAAPSAGTIRRHFLRSACVLKYREKQACLSALVRVDTCRLEKMAGKIGTISQANRFFLDDCADGDESWRDGFSGAWPRSAQPVCTSTTDLPREGPRATAALFRRAGAAAKRFPDAAKRFMVPHGLRLLISNTIKSKACGSGFGAAGLWRAV